MIIKYEIRWLITDLCHISAVTIVLNGSILKATHNIQHTKTYKLNMDVEGSR